MKSSGTQRDRLWRRFFEILPGLASWMFIAGLLLLLVIEPVWAALFLIGFILYWVLRVTYLTILLVFAYRNLRRVKSEDWIEKCKRLQTQGVDKRFGELWHAVLFPIYKERESTLIPSLEALARSQYPFDRVIVVLAVEERGGEEVRSDVQRMKSQFKSLFADFLIVFHPDGLPGESRTKGANITWAARELKKYLDTHRIAYDDVLVSCFDADTRVHPHYFGCLSYQYLIHPNRTHASYQPVPVYHNNIWEAKSFARVIEITSSFWQLIEGMKYEKFVTFSSHSLSMQTLVDVDYWPVDMISDDSAIFWRAYLRYHGDYHVVPMYVTVSMDIATAPTLWGTIKNQYLQKRRWAWGVENFPVIMMAFRKDRKISLWEKWRRATQMFGEHFTWATWAIVIAWIGPLPILFRDFFFAQRVIGYQFPNITAMLFNLTSISILICIAISFGLLPRKPSHVSNLQMIKMFTQWLFTPLITLVMGSLPALDAQTRLMGGKYLGFWVTPKSGDSV